MWRGGGRGKRKEGERGEEDQWVKIWLYNICVKILSVSLSSCAQNPFHYCIMDSDLQSLILFIYSSTHSQICMCSYCSGHWSYRAEESRPNPDPASAFPWLTTESPGLADVSARGWETDSKFTVNPWRLTYDWASWEVIWAIHFQEWQTRFQGDRLSRGIQCSEVSGWWDNLVCKALAVQAWGPVLRFPHPFQKLGLGVHAHAPSIWYADTSGSLSASLDKFLSSRFKERPCVNQ